MRRGRTLFSLVTLLSGAVIVCLGLALAVISADLLAYARLTYERPVGEVSVQSLNPVEKRYTVILRPAQGPLTICVLQGDEWLLSAKVQTWKPWANVFGLNATYALDQLANKYADATEANGKPITACAVAHTEPGFARYIPSELRTWITTTLQAESRSFGMANFMPLADGASYSVIMTQQGLAAEPANDAARAAIKAPGGP
jgi:hypothetical protein